MGRGRVHGRQVRGGMLHDQVHGQPGSELCSFDPRLSILLLHRPRQARCIAKRCALPRATHPSILISLDAGLEVSTPVTVRLTPSARSSPLAVDRPPALADLAILSACTGG